MNKEDKENIVQRVNQEGFDYAFIHYSRFEEIKDKKFHELREQYKEARKKLADYIGFKG